VVGLPAHGRTILAKEAEEVLFLDGRRGSPLFPSGLGLEERVSLEVLSFPDPASEARGVAARAKELILGEGYSPQEVSIVLRELGTRGAELEEACVSFGLPVRAQEGRPLLESPFIRTILKLLSAAERRFPAEELIALLGSSYIPFLKRKGLEAASVTRELSLIGKCTGRGSILRRLRGRLERLKRRERAEKSSSLLTGRAGHEGEREEVISAINSLESFFEVMDLLPARASIEDYAWVLPRMMASLGVGEALQGGEGEGLRMRDLAAWEALARALERLKETHRSLSGDAPMALGSFISELRGLCREVRYPSFESRDEGLSLLDVNNARGLGFRAVLVCGAYEKEFPLSLRENPFLRDDELRRLNRALGRRALKERRERLEEERLLFYLAATRATEKLIISFAVHDAEGHEVLPSPYLAELLGEESLMGLASAALGPGALEPPPYGKIFRKEDLLSRTMRELFPREAPPPEGGDHEELGSALGVLEEISPRPLEQARHGVRVERARGGEEPSGFDGWVTDPGLLSL
ncbi:MAG: PD-(D/E)XK nuclease family protein, partial [Nitrospinota bacterium]